jgi:hypothetical protein
MCGVAGARQCCVPVLVVERLDAGFDDGFDRIVSVVPSGSKSLVGMSSYMPSAFPRKYP